MHLQRLFLRGLVLLAIPTAVAAKKGGGGGGGGIDLDDSTSSDGDSSSDQGGYGIIPSNIGTCPDTSIFSNVDTLLLPPNVRNWTSKGILYSHNPTTYDGSYFEGVASMQWRFTNECRNTTGSVRMRGYGWVGPRPPYPKGTTNPVIISFKAWQLSEVFESSFDGRLFCAPDPGFVKLMTSTQLGHHTLDIVHLDLAPDAKHRDTVLFNGSMVPGINPLLSPEFKIHLPGSACDGQGVSILDLGYPEKANITGSLTNITLALSIAGEGIVPYIRSDIVDARATFNFTFAGTFDGSNSTRAVAIKQDTQPMVFWVDDGGLMYRPVSWMLKLIFMGWIVWFVSEG